MLKKSLTILFVFLAVLLLSTFSFAVVNNVKKAINDGTNMMVDGANKLGTDVKDGMKNMKNGVSDALKMDDTSKMNTTMRQTDTTPNDYTAVRTTEPTMFNNTNTWVWVVLIIAAIVIIGLIWYYVAQDNH